MKRYKCKKSFCVDNYDADGFLIENSATVIEIGKVYEFDESGSTIIGGEVHLDQPSDIPVPEGGRFIDEWLQHPEE